MKLCTYQVGNGPMKLGVALLERNRLLDVAAAHASLRGAPMAALSSMLALIESGAAGMQVLRELTERSSSLEPHLVDMAKVKLRPPLPVPLQIRDCSVFEAHVRNGGAGMARLKARLNGQPAPAAASGDIPPVYRKQPIYYISNRFNVIGPDDVVHWPSYSRVMDFELELAIIIGRTGRDIPVSEAGQHIFGYTIFNDFSARDQQSIEMDGWLGPTKGKSFDNANSIGPWIVTTDELGDPSGLTVSVRVNGKPWVTTNTSGMLHTFADMIAFISKDETLHAGELIGSGTVGGCSGLEIDHFLESGDTVELQVSRIGVLRNKVIAKTT
ncbi:MAG: FAA hydrolase family protein [Betaproteobacteria bacterium]|nr:MAG: FAA hydrolase family protein [Betaproteobacteria bacterium]